MAYVSAVEDYGAAASVIHDDPAHPKVIDYSRPRVAGARTSAASRSGPGFDWPRRQTLRHSGIFFDRASAGASRPEWRRPAGRYRYSSGRFTYSRANTRRRSPTSPPDSIGKVEKVIGDVTAIRNGVAVTLHVGDVVYQSDIIQTGVDSRVGIGFPDGTALELTASTRMALSEYSYDAHSTSNSALLTLVQGTFAFVAGSVAHTGDMKIATPVATMGIRGTTGYVLETGHNYEYVVVDDYASTRHGVYDLYQIDQNGNMVRDQNGLPIILATVSQTEFVTECSLTSCSTTPMTASQLAYAQQIVPQLFQTYLQNNAAPHTNPGGNGSSEPLFQPEGPQNPQLIQLDGSQQNLNSGPGNSQPDRAYPADS